jgi:hypothetical protein
MSGRDRAHALEAGLGTTAGAEPGIEGQAVDAVSLGGIVARAIRSHQLWLTVGYFAVLLLLARAYS